MLVAFVLPLQIRAQQFNSDNYITMPHGVATLIATTGERNSTAYAVLSFLPDWEATLSLNSYRRDPVTGADSYSAGGFYLKHQFAENEQKNGGWAVMGGTGLMHGYQTTGGRVEPLRSYWAAVPVTIPFRNGDVSWDIMPGFNVDLDHGQAKNTVWSGTYSTRLAVYKIVPQSAVVGEVWGATGEGYYKPRYRTGVRWESKKLVIAGTYSETFSGKGGAGFEIGVMYFTDKLF